MAATTISRASLTDSTSPTTGDIWNAALIGTAIYDKIDNLFKADLRLERTTSGDMLFTVANASNTAGSDGGILISVAGASAGDPYLQFTTLGITAWTMGIDNDDSDLFKISAGGTLGAASFNTLVMNTSNHLFINDNADANITTGLTINQGSADDLILSLKSSDVAHGMTTNRETDTYGDFAKVSAADGGLAISGWSETTIGLYLYGAHTTDNTAKSTAATGVIVLDANLKSGTTVTTPGANANLVVFRSAGSAKFIFDAEGDSHEDGTGWTAYDDHDDLALVDAVDRTLDSTLMEREAAAFLREQRTYLEATRIVSFDRDGRPFINKSRLSMLHNGALRQLWRAQQRMLDRLTALEAAA